MWVETMDRTDDFRRALKEVRKTEQLMSSERKHSSILQVRQKRNSSFSVKAKEIVKSVSQLKEFLLQHRNAYINSSQVAGLISQTMSDHERDKIDEEAQSILKKSSEAVAMLQQSLLESGISEQVCTHRRLVLASLQNYIKSICKIYSEQRAIRVKLVVDKKRISRLHNPDTYKKMNLTRSQEGKSSENGDIIKPIRPRYVFDESDDDITEEDAAALEQENALLFNDMNSMVDEIRMIEGKVVEITRLQEIFSEQVLSQEGDIEMISEKVVVSTENIKDGNEEIREAIKNNAGFRVWILFFLVMCSFSLLFLEWYS